MDNNTLQYAAPCINHVYFLRTRKDEKGHLEVVRCDRDQANYAFVYTNHQGLDHPICLVIDTQKLNGDVNPYPILHNLTLVMSKLAELVKGIDAEAAVRPAFWYVQDSEQHYHKWLPLTKTLQPLNVAGRPSNTPLFKENPQLTMLAHQALMTAYDVNI